MNDTAVCVIALSACSVFKNILDANLVLSLLWFQDLNADTELAATNGQTVKALTIFAHALRFFRNHALQELADQSQTCIVDEDVRWIITVPAIWKEPAKQFMRQAAYQVRSYYSLRNLVVL